MFPKPYQLYSAFHAGHIFETYFDGAQWWNLRNGQPVDGDIKDDRLHIIHEEWAVTFTDMYGVVISQKVSVPVDLPVCREHNSERWGTKKAASMSDARWARQKALFYPYWNHEKVAPHVRYIDHEGWFNHVRESVTGRKPTATAVPIVLPVASSMPNYYRGNVYRVPSGYQHDKGTTVADVIRHEQELGNEMPDPLPNHEHLPADQCLWVTTSEEAAMRYSTDGAEPVCFFFSGAVAGHDGDGGILIVNPYRHSGGHLSKFQ